MEWLTTRRLRLRKVRRTAVAAADFFSDEAVEALRHRASSAAPR
jgi:hypothetical protein